MLFARVVFYAEKTCNAELLKASYSSVERCASISADMSVFLGATKCSVCARACVRACVCVGGVYADHKTEVLQEC